MEGFSRIVWVGLQSPIKMGRGSGHEGEAPGSGISALVGDGPRARPELLQIDV